MSDHEYDIFDKYHELGSESHGAMIWNAICYFMIFVALLLFIVGIIWLVVVV